MGKARDLKKRADSMLEEVFRSLFEEIDTEKIRLDVAALKESSPEFHSDAHARLLVRRTALRCAAAGAVSGLPGGLIAIGSLGAELAFLVFQQFRLILGIATVYGHEPSQRERFAEAMSCLAYASGVGTRVFYSESGSCKRSPEAYGPKVAAAKGYTLSFQACSGAKTSNVIANQLGTLSASTALVTISIERRHDAAEDHDEIRVVVADDGHGMREPNRLGYGLLGVRERVSAVSGRLTLSNRSGKGFQVTATLPCAPAQRPLTPPLAVVEP